MQALAHDPTHPSRPSRPSRASRNARRAVFAVMVICLIGFALLAAAVRSEGSMVEFDTALATALHVGATPGLIAAMRAITLFGLQVLWVLLAVAGVALLLRRRWLLLAMLIVTWTGGVLINTVSKAVFVRPRPVFDAPLITAMFYSFPSGHAMFSAIVYGLFAYLLVRNTAHPALRFFIIAGAAMLIGLVAFSRLYLGVHYFSDVAAGILLGLAWLMLCILGLEIAYDRARTYHKAEGSA